LLVLSNGIRQRAFAFFDFFAVWLNGENLEP
jgi:hypothetical protein